MSELPELEAMRAGLSHDFEVKIRNFKVRLRPLAAIEIVQATREAQRDLMDMPEEERVAVAESILLCTKKLIKASTSDVGKNDPKLTDYIMERLRPDEMDFLWKQYLAGCNRCDPALEEMSFEDVEALVSEVKKSPKETTSILTGKSFLELVNISRHLIQKGSQEANSPG